MTLIDDDLLAYATPAERDEIARLVEQVDALNELEADPEVWCRVLFPEHFVYDPAEHHRQFWAWLWAIQPDSRPEAFVGAWPRGGAKSTSAEIATVALGARRVRRYGLYVCDTQDRADDHLTNIGALLESEAVEAWYPWLSEKRVGKHGNSRGWRRNRLWTADGFVVDAIGLDVAARGVKLEDQRPDFLVVDDIDGRHDTPAATRKKIETLTEGVIPAGAENLAVLAIQNLVIPDGVFARLADGRADFLRRRIVSGPIPALEGMRVEHVDGEDVIVDGQPTWEGQGLDRCRELAADWGMRAFRREAQHEVGDAPGALWARDQLDASRVVEHPELDLLVVAVDPSGGKGKGHDEQGIVAVGRGVDGDGYVLDDVTCSLSPMGWGKTAVRLAVELSADRIVVEDNYGGEAMTNTVMLAADALTAEGLAGAERFGSGSPLVRPVNAKLSKGERARPVAALYGEKERPETWPSARVHHVGHLSLLESEQCGWEPDVTSKSPNRVDAAVHGVVELGLVPHRGRRRSVVAA